MAEVIYKVEPVIQFDVVRYSNGVGHKIARCPNIRAAGTIAESLTDYERENPVKVGDRVLDPITEPLN